MLRKVAWTLLATATSLVVVPWSHSFATWSGKVSNISTIQTLGPTGTWKLCAGLTSASACTSTGYIATTATTCTASINKTVALAGSGATVQLNNVTSLFAGMTVTVSSGTTTIISPGVNWIASIASPNVTLGISGNTFTNPTTLTFSTCTGQSTFLSLNNLGSTAINTANLVDATNISAGQTMKLQSCNSGGVGTTSLAWDETHNLCVGQINVIASVTSVTTPLTTSSYSLPMAATTGTLRLRAVSSQTGSKTLTTTSSLHNAASSNLVQTINSR